MKAKPTPAILTVGELADFLRAHQTTVYRLIKQGKIPCFKVGSDYRFSRAIIEKWMEPK